MPADVAAVGVGSTGAGLTIAPTAGPATTLGGALDVDAAQRSKSLFVRRPMKHAKPKSPRLQAERPPRQPRRSSVPLVRCAEEFRRCGPMKRFPRREARRLLRLGGRYSTTEGD